jgi:hypothetical protein
VWVFKIMLTSPWRSALCSKKGLWLSHDGLSTREVIEERKSLQSHTQFHVWTRIIYSSGNWQSTVSYRQLLNLNWVSNMTTISHNTHSGTSVKRACMWLIFITIVSTRIAASIKRRSSASCVCNFACTADIFICAPTDKNKGWRPVWPTVLTTTTNSRAMDAMIETLFQRRSRIWTEAEVGHFEIWL